jgi:hypothetical protein
MGFTTDLAGNRRPAGAVIRLPPLLRPEHERDLLPDRNFGEWFAHMEASRSREFVFFGHVRGYFPGEFETYQNVAAWLARATAYVMDPTKPFATKVCRCRWCEKFYVARKNPNGGPANRIYCRPSHRKAHHDSGERKNALLERARRHK